MKRPNNQSTFRQSMQTALGAPAYQLSISASGPCPDGWSRPAAGQTSITCPPGCTVRKDTYGGCQACTCGCTYPYPNEPATEYDCPFGYEKLFSSNGCGGCFKVCKDGYSRTPPSCPAGQVPYQDRETGCYTCGTVKCPSPYVPAPQVCQTGWHAVRHPQYFQCSVCVPDAGLPVPPKELQEVTPPPATPPAEVEPSVPVSTGIKIGAGVLVAGGIVLFLLARK